MPDQEAEPEPTRRIGVFGGTFDPPHIGHLITAIDVRHELRLDRMLLVVANEPWQKTTSRQVTPASTRLEMVRAAVEGEPGLEASDLEIRRGGPSYSIDTIEQLRAADPDAELFLLVGSDAAAGLPTWHRAGDLTRSCRLVVVERPGANTPVPEGFDPLHVVVPRLEVSSTELRERAADGRPLRHLVPDAVISLMRAGDLYGGRR